EHLHQANQPRLLVLVGDLPRGGREKEEGQDEEAGAGIHHQAWIGRSHARALEGDQDHHGVLEHVVIEGAEELCDEEREKAFLAQQLELSRHESPLIYWNYYKRITVLCESGSMVLMYLATESTVMVSILSAKRSASGWSSNAMFARNMRAPRRVNAGMFNRA